MTFVAHTLVFLAIVAAVLVAAAAVTFLMGRRFLRRRLRGVRNHVATRGLLTTLSLVAAWRERVGARVTPEAASRGSAPRTRRRMWVAIEDAEAAVHHADMTNAPVAELPAVCRSLREVAGQLDALLRLERRLPSSAAGPDAVRTQVADIITAARSVQSAALQACGDANEPQIRALVREAGNEIQIVAAALARMRSISPS